MAEFKAGPRRRPPTHPGEIIATNLEALGMTPYAAAQQLGISKQLLAHIIKGGKVSAENALRLGKFFGNGPDLWLNMQQDCDVYAARQKLGGALDAIKKVKMPPDDLLPDELPGFQHQVGEMRAPKRRG